MVTIALSMPMSSKQGYHRSLKQMGKRLIGMGIILAVAFWASTFFNANYLLMRNARGIPIISAIAAPYYWLVVLPILIFGMDFATRLLRRFDFWMANHRPYPPEKRKVAFLHGRV
jgi:ABC-type glycerol-3-phosphate transport system permease component